MFTLRPSFRFGAENILKWPYIQRHHSMIRNSDKPHYLSKLPCPEQLTHPVDISGVRTLLLSNVINGLTKKVQLNLQALGVKADVFEVQSEKQIQEVAENNQGNYDIIICPFLTKRVPKSVWEMKEVPCLIMHPGIAGDRGMTSIDYAIEEGLDQWGISIIQADEEMDVGDIWSTVNFPIDPRTSTKTGLYNGPVSDAAVGALIDSVKRFVMEIPPTPLDYSHPDVKGSLKPNMRHSQRRIDWAMPANDIARQIRKSDTQPGARSTLPGLEGEVVLFGGHVQTSDKHPALQQFADCSEPGEVVAQKDGAVLIKAGDENFVWVTHMKRAPKKSSVKLPAAQILAPEMGHLLAYKGVSSWQEICLRTDYESHTAVIYFDFYNGAMSTYQCHRLKEAILQVGKDPLVDVVVLLGGPQYFSTGIHLNTIEAAFDPAEESWNNINAINDVIEAMTSLNDKVTISALQGAAGAGGVMVAAAADLMWARNGLVLSPSYKSMHLSGSEYWTYFLPSRVGHRVAEYLTESGLPLLSQEAQIIGLVDATFGSTHNEFLALLPSKAKYVAEGFLLEDIRTRKHIERTPEWFERLKLHRKRELEKMWKCFNSEEYIKARKAFVYH